MSCEENHHSRWEPMRRIIRYIIDCQFVEISEAPVSILIYRNENDTADEGSKRCKPGTQPYEPQQHISLPFEAM